MLVIDVDSFAMSFLAFEGTLPKSMGSKKTEASSLYKTPAIIILLIYQTFQYR